MVLKEPICPFINCVACIFDFIWSDGLEMNQDLLQFYHVYVPYSSKYGCFAQGNDLTDCLWLDIN